MQSWGEILQESIVFIQHLYVTYAYGGIQDNNDCSFWL